MIKKVGMMLALLGAMALYGSNSAISSPAEPSNLMDYIKAKRAAAQKAKPVVQSPVVTRTKTNARNSTVTHPAKKKNSTLRRASVKKQNARKGRPVVHAKARVKTVVRNADAGKIDTMTTGSVVNVAP